MNTIDILLILALGAIMLLALRRTIKTRKSGGCGCGCAGCDGKRCAGRK